MTFKPDIAIPVGLVLLIVVVTLAVLLQPTPENRVAVAYVQDAKTGNCIKIEGSKYTTFTVVAPFECMRATGR